MGSPEHSTRLIFVLGMHRSGTSVLARSLQVLGIEAAPAPDQTGLDNPKGFWEDPEVVRVNERILEHLGLAWDSTHPIPPSVWSSPHLAELRAEARSFLEQVESEHRLYAVKDPRLCLTLPLWIQQARQLKIQASLVLALRHPTSVAGSLQARNYFAHEKSYLLWTAYLCSVLRGIPKQPLYVVQYDDLLGHPDRQIQRIAGLLELGHRLDPEEMRTFREDFLDSDLRHNQAAVQPEKITAETEAEELALDLYALLLECSAGGAVERSSGFNRRLRTINDRFSDLSFLVNNDQSAIQAQLTTAAGSVRKLKQTALGHRSGTTSIFRKMSLLDRATLEQAQQIESLHLALRTLAAENAGLEQQLERRAAEARKSMEDARTVIAQARTIIARERISVRMPLERWLYYFLRQPDKTWIPSSLKDYARRRAEELDRGTLIDDPVYPVLVQELAPETESNAQQFSPAPDSVAKQGPSGLATDPAPPTAPLPKPPVVVVLPVMNWQDQTRRSRKILEGFATLGYSIVYVAPFFADIQEARPWELEELDLDNAWMCRLACNGPVPNIYRNDGTDSQILQLTLAFSDCMEKAGAKHWTFFFEAPFWHRILASFPTQDLVAGALDPYFEGMLNAEVVDSNLIRLFRGSDVVVVSTQAEKAGTEHITQTLCVENEESDVAWTASARRIVEAIGAGRPPVSVVVLCYNNLELTKACIDSLVRYSDYPDLELIVVDNASSDGTGDYLRSLDIPGVKLRTIVNEANLGFAGGNNMGLREANGDYLALLNNDTVVTPGWIHNLLRPVLSNPRIGAIGPVSNQVGNEACIAIEYKDTDEMLRAAASYTAGHHQKIETTSTLGFFCVLIPRAVYSQVGDLDERFGVGMFEDDDYCNRIRQAGYSLAITHGAFVHHHQSAAFSQIAEDRKQRLFATNKKIYENKWGRWHVPRQRPLKDFEL